MLKPRPRNIEHSHFARYRAMLPRLEALEKEAQEVRHRVQATRKLIS